MNRSLACLVTLALLALAGCSPSASPTPPPAPPTLALAIPAASTPTASPTVAVPTPDLSRLLSEQLTSANPLKADQTVEELTEWAREVSGLRAALGPQADEIFRLADQAEAAAVQDMLRQLQPSSKPKGRPAPLPPRLSRSIGPGQFAGLVNVLTVLESAPSLLGSPQDGNTIPITSDKESSEKIGENGTATIKTKTTAAGSRIEVQVTMNIRAAKDGNVYEEQVSGKISLNVCPDPLGNLPLDFTYQTKAGANEVGFGLQSSDHAVGHVDDEANLTSIDQELQTEMSVTKGKNWLTGAPDTSFVQVNFRYTTEGLTKESKDWSFSGAELSIPRSSFLASPDIAQGAMKMGIVFSTLVWNTVLPEAQKKWQNGYCVAVAVPEGEEQRVENGSETPFTATVRHKFEGQALTVPVIAALASGPGSVIPSGIKVPAPAAFRYKAPDQAGEEATAELVSRSRRGIGRLTIGFKIDGWFYTVDQSVADGRLYLTGDVCALDQPFTLTVEGRNAGSGKYVGTFKFAPSGIHGGSWTHKATTTCLPELGCGTITASGTYDMAADTDGRVIVQMHETIQHSAIAGYSGEIPMPRWEFELKPMSMHACRAE